MCGARLTCHLSSMKTLRGQNNMVEEKPIERSRWISDVRREIKGDLEEGRQSWQDLCKWWKELELDSVLHFVQLKQLKIFR